MPAATNPAYTYRAALERVVDGDTLDIHVDLGFGVTIKQRFRIYGINAPEIFSVKIGTDERSKGEAAKQFVSQQLPTVFTVKTYKDGQEKYGRYLCDVLYVDPNGVEHNLALEMITAGHAVRAEYK